MRPTDRIYRSCLATLLAVTVMAGCSGPSAIVPERYAAEKAAEVALSTYDSDKSGRLEPAELDKCLALKHAIPRIDKDNDKTLSADEIAGRVAAYEKDAELMSCVVQIVSNGQPVSGATVKLELEPFMGADLPTYVVMTDQAGSGAPQLEGAEEPVLGIPIGFYKITISPPSQAAPVVRGCEVASDSPTSNRLMFSLESEAPLGGPGGHGGR
jgi:hypothetical protein